MRKPWIARQERETTAWKDGRRRSHKKGDAARARKGNQPHQRRVGCCYKRSTFNFKVEGSDRANRRLLEIASYRNVLGMPLATVSE